MDTLDAVLARYGSTLFDERMMSGSLDHVMWFHQPFRADYWRLFARQPPIGQSGPVLRRGLIFRVDGTLVASVAQRRPRRSSARPKLAQTHLVMPAAVYFEIPSPKSLERASFELGLRATCSEMARSISVHVSYEFEPL
ncbi:hypothetical protein ABIA40_000366 [Bradyrhizobium sp. USDA 223]